jgi:hypothetical protein
MSVQKEAMTRVGEIISLIGVMGSLIFVGLEVRQGAIATRAANDTVIAEAFREINQIMASSPDLARALTAYADDPASDQVRSKCRSSAYGAVCFIHGRMRTASI